jgi:hypothetical protein
MLISMVSATMMQIGMIMLAVCRVAICEHAHNWDCTFIVRVSFVLILAIMIKCV